VFEDFSVSVHKAFLYLSKSKILNIRERLICLNVINNELSPKDKNTLHNKIISSSIHNLNKIKREHENKLYFIQSRTAMNCISFINHQDEEDFRNVLKVKEDECLPDLKELYNSIGDVLRVILLFTNHNNELNFQLTTNELGDILYNKAMPSLGVSNMKELFSQRLVNQEYINNIHKRYRCNDTLETNFLIILVGASTNSRSSFCLSASDKSLIFEISLPLWSDLKICSARKGFSP
jgi:hypothetical protein